MRSFFVLSVTLSCAAAILLLPIDAIAHSPDVRADATPARGAVGQTLSGTIRELVVVDRVGVTTTRYVSLIPPQGRGVALQGPGIDGLQAGSQATVDGTRNGDVLFVEAIRSSPAKASPIATSPDVTFEGTLALLHADDLEHGTSSYVYELHRDDGTTTELDLGARPDVLRPGMRVAASGKFDSKALILDTSRIEIFAMPPQTKDAKDGISAVTTHSVLVVLLKFKDTASDPFPVSTAQQVMTANATSVANYYSETSFGQHPLNVTVTSSWVQSATLAQPATCNTADWQAIGNAADAAATAAGYTSVYEFRVYVFPTVSACGWSGLGYIGAPRKAYINGSMSTLVVAHEMGHNFGLYHAASLDCGTGVIGGACSASEYGDPFDVMGNQRAMHFNAAQKSKLGWLPAGSVSTHSSGTANYTLSPIETAGGASYAVKIPVLSNRTYWLEYRQPVGMDAGLSAFPNNGAQIRVASPFETVCSGCADDTEFLDLTPSTSAFTDGALTVGGRFRDDISGLTINVVSATATALNVNIGFTDDILPPDFNASGTTDLLWNHAGSGATTAWLMNGAATIGSATLLTDVHWNVVAAGDFDGDGKADLVWYNATTGNTSMWLMNGTAMASGRPLLTDPDWHVVLAADFDGDGKSDLLWRNNATGATAIWLMNGTTYASGTVILTDPNWSVTHAGDLDGDGKADLVWRNAATGATALWLLNGTTFRSGTIVLVDPKWRVTHVGDFDGDGKADLLWRNDTTGTTSMWLMNGTTMASGATLLTDVNSRVVAIGDFDNDGKKDLVWRNDVSGAKSIWLMSGTGTKSSASIFTDLQTDMTHVGDFNGDGRADLVLRNSATGVTSLWLMNGTTHSGGGTLMTDPGWRVVNPY